VIDRDKLQRDIETLRESVQLSWQDLDRLSLSPSERDGIIQNIELTIGDLSSLLSELERMNAQGT
jgi:hypothetical protein